MEKKQPDRAPIRERSTRPGFGPRSGENPGDPTLSKSRAAVLRTIRAQSEPTSLAALARNTGLHPNTLREHLDALLDAKLVRRHSAKPAGRGRPAWLYAPVDTEPQNEYARLASALASALADASIDPVGDATRAGDAWGTSIVQSRGGSRVDSQAAARREVIDVLDDLGFEPESSSRDSRVRLTRCPLLEAANKNPEIVCAVHEGLVRGVLSEVGIEQIEPKLVPFAERGACVLHLPSRRKQSS